MKDDVRRRIALGGALAVGATVGLLLVALNLPVLPPGSVGPLRVSDSTVLTFPHCARVTVHWSTVVGARVAFAIYPPEEVSFPDCRGSPPTNDTCVSPWCGPGPSLGPGPVCFEVGADGTCSFTASQDGYTVVVWNSTGPTIAHEPVVLTANWPGRSG
jgi:hypothetical protein